jgi:hypothetical protein
VEGKPASHALLSLPSSHFLAAAPAAAAAAGLVKDFHNFGKTLVILSLSKGVIIYEETETNALL